MRQTTNTHKLLVENKDYSLLGFNAVLFEETAIFQGNIFLPSSGSKNKLSHKPVKLPPSSSSYLHNLLFNPEDGSDMSPEMHGITT
jgi:hypothetical protein